MNFLEEVFLDMYIDIDELISYFMEMIGVFILSCVLCGIGLVLLKMKSNKKEEHEEHYIFCDSWKPIEDIIQFIFTCSLVFMLISFCIFEKNESIYVFMNIEIIRCIWYLYAIRYGMIVRKNKEEMVMEKKCKLNRSNSFSLEKDDFKCKKA